MYTDLLSLHHCTLLCLTVFSCPYCISHLNKCSSSTGSEEQTGWRQRETENKEAGVSSDPASPTHRPSDQSALGYANDLAAPHRPCPGVDVIRTSLCLALQGLRQKQQRTGGKPAGEGPFVRKEYYYYLHRWLWSKHVFLCRLSAHQHSPARLGLGHPLSIWKTKGVDALCTSFHCFSSPPQSHWFICTDQ